jgi:hypothetical protein
MTFHLPNADTDIPFDCTCGLLTAIIGYSLQYKFLKSKFTLVIYPRFFITNSHLHHFTVYLYQVVHCSGIRNTLISYSKVYLNPKYLIMFD